MTADEQSTPRTRDFLANPLTAAFWWGLPLAAGWIADASPVPRPESTSVWAVALAWMGVGCALNAGRHRRLHCFIAAPVLLVGALSVALAAAGLAPFGPHGASYLINGTLALALASFVAEAARGRYRRG